MSQLEAFVLCHWLLLGHCGYRKHVIWQAWRLHFGTLRDNFGTSGAPSGSMGAAGRTLWGPESDFYGFGGDFLTKFESFVFVLLLAARSYTFALIFVFESERLGLPECFSGCCYPGDMLEN